MGKILTFVMLVLTTFLLFYPIAIMVGNSFTPAIGFLDLPPKVIPYRFTMSNYQQILGHRLIERWIANSLLLIITVTTVSIAASAMAGYVCGNAKGRIITVIFWMFLVPIFVTRITILVAQFVIVYKLRLNGLPAAIMMPLYWPIGIFLFRNAFQAIPEDYLESARIDGANEAVVFGRIALPMVKPVVGLGIIMQGMASLGDYIWQMLNLKAAQKQTLLVALLNTTIDVTVIDQVGYDLAVGTVLLIPYVIIFAFSGRYFAKGLSEGGLRG